METPDIAVELYKPDAGDSAVGISSMEALPGSQELQEEIQRLKASEKEFRKLLEWLGDEITKWRILLDQSREGIVVLDGEGGVVEANQRFADMLGYSLDEVRKLRVWNWDSLFSEAEIREMLRTVDASGAHIETRHRRKDGIVIDVELNNNASVFRDRKLILCLCRDITEYRRAEEELRESERKFRELSVVDELTQLFNYRHFMSQLRMEVLRSDRYDLPLCLLFADIDDFKQYNDTFGHVEGDLVLQRTGQIITRCIRQTDYPFRYGGEEFAILLPMTSREDAIGIAERILGEFKNEHFSPVPVKPVSVTVSIGLAQYEPPEDVQDFVRRADQCMYEAKRNGKNRISFDR